MNFPVKVPDGNGGVLTFNTAEGLHSYQAEKHAQMTKVSNQRGEPQPNFSVQPTAEELAMLRKTGGY